MEHGRLASILGPYSGIDFFPHNPSKNTGSVLLKRSWKRLKDMVHHTQCTHLGSDGHRLEISVDWRWPRTLSVMMVISAQLAQGGDWCPPHFFYSIYPIHSVYVVPSTPFPARLAIYSYLYSPISPLSPSTTVEKTSFTVAGKTIAQHVMRDDLFSSMLGMSHL